MQYSVMLLLTQQSFVVTQADCSEAQEEVPLVEVDVPPTFNVPLPVFPPVDFELLPPPAPELPPSDLLAPPPLGDPPEPGTLPLLPEHATAVMKASITARKGEYRSEHCGAAIAVQARNKTENAPWWARAGGFNSVSDIWATPGARSRDGQPRSWQPMSHKLSCTTVL